MSHARLFTSFAMVVAVAGTIAAVASAAQRHLSSLSATPPTVALVSQPAANSTATSATIAWQSQGGLTTTCSTDNEAPVTCISPVTLTGLSAGAHHFAIRVANQAGSNHAIAYWTTTAITSTPAPTPPSASIASGPASITTSTSAVFTFLTANARTVSCALDGGAATACSGSITYGPLAAGAHTFKLTAAAGSLQASTVFAWTVTLPAPPPPPVPTTTAHLWVSTSGSSSCTRNSSAVSYSAALANGNVCDTGPRAYAKANLGDTALIETSTFTSEWNFARGISKTATPGTCNYNYGGASNFTNCITFEPALGQTFTFNVAGNTSPQVVICASFVSIQNATVTETDYTDGFGDTVSNDAVRVGSGDNTCGTTAPHDIYLANDILGGRIQIQGGVTNVWEVGGTITSLKDLSPQIGNGGGNNGLIANTNHSGIVGVTFDGYNFADTDPAHHHMECLHDTGGSNHITIAGNRFLSCPVESFFVQTSGNFSLAGGTPVQDNILVENNYFDSGGPLKFDCTNTNCQNTNITVRFNTFSRTNILLQAACNSSGSCSGATIDNDRIYGNVAPGCPAVGFGTAGATGTLWTTSYNVQTGPQSNVCTGDTTSAYSHAATFMSPGSPNYNLDLNGTQAATNFVPSSVTGGLPGANIHGAVRAGAYTNAGAN